MEMGWSLQGIFAWCAPDKLDWLGIYQPNPMQSRMRSHTFANHRREYPGSGSVVELKLIIRDKLSKAVYSDLSGSPIASRVTFGSVWTLNVLLSSTNQVYHLIQMLDWTEEVSICTTGARRARRSQRIARYTFKGGIFSGNVVADILEVHSLINERYHLADAVDIHSTNQVQVIEGVPTLISSSPLISRRHLSWNFTRSRSLS